ncbi:MAG: PIN domain-containing protein [Alphaproteobacteria bacterium]
MLDTSVAIELRDNNDLVRSRVGALDEVPSLSIMTRIELEGGVWRDPTIGIDRERRLDTLLDAFKILPFDEDEAAAYREIIKAVGFSRRKIVDRMIASQALVVGAILVTLNPDDFKDIPGLQVLAW